VKCETFSVKSVALNVENRPFSAAIFLTFIFLTSLSQNRKSTVRRPFLNRKSTVTISGQLRLVTPVNAYERHPTIFPARLPHYQAFGGGATATATKRSELQLIAVGCGRMHPVAPNTIFSAEPQQVQLPHKLYRKLYRKRMNHAPRGPGTEEPTDNETLTTDGRKSSPIALNPTKSHLLKDKKFAQ